MLKHRILGAVAALLAFGVTATAEARGGGGSGRSLPGAARSSLYEGYSARSLGTSSSHYASGYARRDGTQVQSYHATNPNGSALDNYSTRGNINPYTGQSGTKIPR